MRSALKISMENPEEKKSPLGRPICRWDDNIKTYFGEVGCRLDSFG
jgi:hypothetical protein